MQPPSDNVWIGDLPPQLTKNELATLFEAYGPIVECRMLPPKAEGQKACAMVRYASTEIATWVVENLNGNIAEGLEEPIIVRFANAPGWKQQGGGKGWQTDAGPYGSDGGGGWAMKGKGAGKGGGGGKNGKPGAPESFASLYKAVKTAGLLGGMEKVPEECTVYIKNLPADTTDLDLYKLFAPFGAIAPTGVKAMQNPDGSCKGFGFADFTDPVAAATAVMGLASFSLPDGTTIDVSQKLPPSTKGKAKGKSKGNMVGNGVEEQQQEEEQWTPGW